MLFFYLFSTEEVKLFFFKFYFKNLELRTLTDTISRHCAFENYQYTRHILFEDQNL